MANNQYNFLDYAGLSLFWNNVKSIIEENELATASALTNLDTRVDNLEASKADKDGTGATGTWGISVSGNAATSDRTKFLETFQQHSTTNTYGSQYPIWAQWSDSTNVRLKCTNYTVWTDKATTATTATKVGTSTVGSATLPVYINSGTPTVINSLPESYLSWGGLPIEGDISPIDAACCSDFDHNKLAFLPADCITVEYTTNGGSTWIDYGASDVQKISLVTSETAFYIGKGAASATDGTMTNSNCSNYQVRVTVSSINSSGTHKIYTNSKKLLINISSNGASGCKIKMETQTIGDYNNNVDTWTTIKTYNVSGWSAWNSIPLYFSGGSFGGFEDQTYKVAKLRLTLSITGVVSSSSQASILGLRLIGTSSWINPSIMSKTGHLYSYDAYQNAEFPAAVKATNFRISGGTSSQFLKADGSLDSNTYSKSGHTHTKSEITDFVHTHTKSQITDFAHGHTGSEVTLTGYSKVSSYSEISASDTVNQAIAKLEYVLSGLEDLLASI